MKKTITFTKPHTHAGVTYAPGQTLEVDEVAYDAIKAAGSLEPAEAPSPAPVFEDAPRKR